MLEDIRKLRQYYNEASVLIIENDVKKGKCKMNGTRRSLCFKH
jgi:hypothetical protein